MNALLLKEQVQHDKFLVAIKQWLAGEVGGHLGAYMYTEDSDDHRWKDGHSAESYYLGRDDKASFDLVMNNLDIRATHLLDLGPGGEESVRAKTIPLAQKISARYYYPVDLAHTLAADAAICVGASLDIQSNPIETDFFESLPLNKTDTLVALMGGTLGNLETHPTLDSLEKRLIGIFVHYRHATCEQGYFLTSFDANMHSEEVLNCYDSKQFDLLVRSCIERALNTEGFDYDVTWDQKTCQLALGLRSNRDQIIKFAGEEFAVEKGEFLSVLNSYRFSPRFIKQAATKAGWRHQQTWSATGRMHYLLFN